MRAIYTSASQPSRRTTRASYRFRAAGIPSLAAAGGAAAAANAPTALVPNDCEIGSASERLMLLTGPNASGKTVYLRTVAMIVYLAHVGSYVPAESATVARTDAIHTRMHSKESAAVNHSAFMLDLSQMASIFKHATARTLCLIDEFGKGTNAQDGISLLYASLADLLSRGDNCPRVLACTHFTELLEIPGFREQAGLSLWTMQVLLKDTRQPGAGGAADVDMEPIPTGGTSGEIDALSGLDDWRRLREADEAEEEEAAAASDWHGDRIAPLSAALDEEVVFLYKAIRGACTDSFGSHCAAACNMPPTVIARARHVSRCRMEGLPIERYDVDTDAAATTEKNLASLVDCFLQYDFATGSAADFFGAVEGLTAQLAA